MRQIAVLISLTALLLAGCSNDLSFIVEYDNAEGLKKGDAIVHSDKVIGEIKDILYTDAGKIQVSVNVQEAFRDLAQTSSLFYINSGQDYANKDKDSNDKANKFIELVTNAEEAGSDIIEGQIVLGSNKVEGLVQSFSNQFGQALQSFTTSVQTSWGEFKGETLDQQIEYVEVELDKIIKKAKSFNEKTRNYFENEVLPKLNQKIDQLRQQLEEFDREDELDGVEEKLLKAKVQLQA